MNTTDKLKQIFCDNFVQYYRAHSVHLNITGEDFYANHKLLEKIYEYHQDTIDVIGELVRANGDAAPETIQEILASSDLSEATAVATTADVLLELVIEGEEHLVAAYKDLVYQARDEEHCDIENFAQDQILKIKKFVWQLKAIIE